MAWIHNKDSKQGLFCSLTLVCVCVCVCTHLCDWTLPKDSRLLLLIPELGQWASVQFSA